MIIRHSVKLLSINLYNAAVLLICTYELKNDTIVTEMSFLSNGLKLSGVKLLFLLQQSVGKSNG